jgi:hypothetical protein
MEASVGQPVYDRNVSSAAPIEVLSEYPIRWVDSGRRVSISHSGSGL